jgi:glycopeptide antibiotics resistance protein
MDRVWDVALEGSIPMALFVVALCRRPRRDQATSRLGDWFGKVVSSTSCPLRSIATYLSQWDETTVPATQILGNVLLFFPWGLPAPARWPRFRRPLPMLAAAALIALAIEILQFISAQGRVTSTDDVILAIVGAAAGWLGFRVIAAIASLLPHRGGVRK